MDMEIGSAQTAWSSSVQGYQKAEGSMAKRAVNIADWSRESAADAPPRANSPDPTNEIVGMKTDQLAGSYNLKALKIQNRMAGELMDLIG